MNTSEAAEAESARRDELGKGSPPDARGASRQRLGWLPVTERRSFSLGHPLPATVAVLPLYKPSAEARLAVNERIGQFPAGGKGFYNSRPLFPTGGKWPAKLVGEGD